jgi:1-acyl-sn-glycerol-3-phosphate acyltransferase
MSRKDAAADVSMEHRLQQVDTRWVRVVVWIFTPFLRWYYRVEAQGLENIEKSPGGALFVANHNAGYVLDILALAYIVKPWRHTERKIVGMGRGGPVDAPIFKQIIRKMGCIPDGARLARDALRSNCWVLVCPGGVRGVIRPIWKRNTVCFDWQRSYVRLAQAEGCPIYPVAISGSHETVPVLCASRTLWKIIPGVRWVVPGAGAFPITLNHVVNLAVFLALPIAHGSLAWAVFVLLNLYVDAVFFWPWLPAKIRVRFGPPIRVLPDTAPGNRSPRIEEGHRNVVAAVEGMLMEIHNKRPWPKFLV